jgi:hypothetical protein
MNGSERHLDDVAALYALGALDDPQRRDVERHVVGCDRCAARLGEAERDVAQLAEAEIAHPAPSDLASRLASIVQPPIVASWVVAVAAALVIGFLPAAYLWQQDRAMHAVMTSDAQVLSRLATAPHRSAAFSPMPGRSTARVMYGPDGSWYVVVVAHPAKALDVCWMHGGRQVVLGTAVPRGDVATLYLPKSHRMDRLALMDGETVVAEAQLAY